MKWAEDKQILQKEIRAKLDSETAQFYYDELQKIQIQHDIRGKLDDKTA